MSKRNGKGSLRRVMRITREEESERWRLSMKGAKLPPSCDYCVAKSIKAICKVCVGYDRFTTDNISGVVFPAESGEPNV